MAAAGVGVATAAVASLSKVALDSYADYEQLVGGVETLFKESADVVQAYADEAYKSAGMSANEYMETVTSFSASLLQGLGGDTAAAAEISNKAIVDMSDNANKMGTDMSLIQNAYQGFAKQNYTMLDNLKLGYGGTQAEMARLINDSGVLGDSMEVTAKTVNEVSFDKIIEAIHVVQTEMGITGTTAKEAASTISGSLSAAKSAWSNLLTGIADENANMDTLIGNFVDSAYTVADNIMPRVEQILGGIGTMVSKMAPLTGEAITMLVGDVLPQFVEAGADLVAAVGSALLDESDLLIQNGLDMILMLAEGLVQGLPNLITGAATLIDSLTIWLGEYSVVLVESATAIVGSLVKGIIQAIPSIASAAQNIIWGFMDVCEYALPDILNSGVAFINEMVNGILSEIPNMVSQLPAIFEAIVGFIMDNLPMILEAGMEILMNLVEGIANTIPELIPVALDAINQILQTIQENLPKILQMGFTLLLKFVDGISNALGNLVSKVWEMRDIITDGLSEAIGRVFDIGADIVRGLWDGISGMWSWLKEKVAGMVSGLIDAFSFNVGDLVSGPSNSPNSINGSHAGGLNYVPFDGYIAELHKGERVLTADEARAMDIPSANYRSDDDFYGDKPKSGGLVMYFNVTVTGNMDDESARRYGKLMGEKAAQELRAKGVTA